MAGVLVMMMTVMTRSDGLLPNDRRLRPKETKTGERLRWLGGGDQRRGVHRLRWKDAES